MLKSMEVAKKLSTDRSVVFIILAKRIQLGITMFPADSGVLAFRVRSVHFQSLVLSES